MDAAEMRVQLLAEAAFIALSIFFLSTFFISVFFVPFMI
jgi:hypothetical protein